MTRGSITNCVLTILVSKANNKAGKVGDTLVELVDGSVNSLFELLNTQQQCRRTGYIWDREAYGMDLEEEPDHHTTKGLSMQPQKFLR